MNILYCFSLFLFFFFFFQAEDGIRDRNVTGIQTCALPICPHCMALLYFNRPSLSDMGRYPSSVRACEISRTKQIGRASCRERVEVSGVGGVLKKKRKRQRMEVAMKKMSKKKKKVNE